eukprot:5386434-Lingulodinium_polyedra.AAC.1
MPAKPLSYGQKKRLQEAFGTPAKAPVALNELAASAFMKELSVARVARLDLRKATRSFVCMVTKWDSECGRRFHRL